MRQMLLGLCVLVTGCQCNGKGSHAVTGELALVWTDSTGETKIDRDATYDFGTVKQGDTGSVTVVARNLGAGPLTLQSLTQMDGDPGFAVPLDGMPVLSAGESRSLPATFTPTAGHPDAYLAHLVLTALDAAPGTSQAKLTLTATSLESQCVVPQRLDFGSVSRGDQLSLTFTIDNATTEAATAFIGDPMGSDGPAFEVDPRGNVTVPAMHSQTVTVRFSPTELRAYASTLQVRPADGCPSTAMQLLGQGVDSVLTWSPDPLDFGYVPSMARSTVTETFTNLGKAAVTVDGFSTTRNVFSTAATTLTVPGEGTATVDIVFAPQVLGPQLGQLTFSTSLPKQAQGSLSLKGYGGGPEIDVDPAQLSFGQVAFFPSSPSTQVRKIVVRNLGTQAPDPSGNLHLGVKQTDGSYAAPYVEIAPSSPGTDASELSVAIDPASLYDPNVGLVAVAGKNTLDLLVSLTPLSLGTKQAVITVHSNDYDESSVQVTVTADVVTLPPCNYQVTPSDLNFGVVSPPGLRELSFTVTNLSQTAGNTCLISALDLSTNGDSSFSLPAGPIDAQQLQPGEQMKVKVRSWPQANATTLTSVSGAVGFYVSSPSAPTAKVTLEAQVGPSCMVISPDQTSYGTVKVGCNAPARGFTVYNACTTTVVINSISMANAAGEAAGGPACPGTTACPEFLLTQTPVIPTGGLSFAPGAAPITFQAKYSPIDIGPDDGSIALDVTVNGTHELHVVGLSGAGDTTGHNTDVFQQTPVPMADILLMIDGSCSMATKEQLLASNTTAFFSYAQSQGVDYHIAVAQAQGAPSNPSVGTFMSGSSDPDRVLTPTTSNVAAQFQAKVQGVGANGADEQCFAPAVAALTAPLITSTNVNFLRPDAPLAIVCITDDSDYSPDTVSFYYAALTNVKGASRLSLFSLSAIAVFQNVCNGSIADNGRYAQMVSLTGGVKQEICDPNWAQTLQSISKTAFGGRGTFYLTAIPDTSTNPVTVTVDGMVLNSTTGTGQTVWTYDAVANAITFDPLYTPAAGSTIAVGYDVSCL